MNKILIILSLFTLITLFGCSDNSVDGSGTGTGNPVILGQVISDNDTAFINASVKMRPVNYYSDDSLSFITDNSLFKIKNVSTDKAGIFIIDSVDSGEYLIEVSGKNNESVLYNCSVSLDDDTIFLAHTPSLQNDTIKGKAAVLGGDGSEITIYVKGLEKKVVADNGDFQIILPAGKYNLKAVTEKNEVGILRDVNSYFEEANINVLAENPISNSYICDTLIVRAILDSNNISRSAIYHAFVLDSSYSHVFQVDIEDPSFHTLPAIIGGMRNLEELEIQFGQLSELPKEIGLLTEIRELELTGNKLKTLPLEIMNLTPTNELDLSGNQFENLPQEIVDWGNKYNATW